MKKLVLLLVLFSSLAFTADAQKSPRMEAKGVIDGTNVVVDYGAPSVRGRTIWGGLEPYDKVWRAGANENTTMSFDKDVMLADQKLPAGKYGFFIIPKKEGDWTVIFSKRNADWGAYKYDKSQDALRLDIEAQWSDKSQEQLMYAVEGNQIVFAWEKARLVIPIAAK